MSYASVIIPTFNRARYLAIALKSLLQQACPATGFEVIVVDNNSTDDTPGVVRQFAARSSNIRYVKEPEQGLHNGRHRGAKEARGDILVYTDDDVICEKDWLTELLRCYDDPLVGSAGGKILPLWEAEPPRWIARYHSYLSLLDHGEGVKELDKPELYGCNFSIRKDILYKYGGFHPDGFPDRLIWCRGDGETGLLNKLLADHIKVVYSSRAVVRHIIPAGRLTLDYIRKRSFNEGISSSFTLHHCQPFNPWQSRMRMLKLSALYCAFKLASVLFKIPDRDLSIKLEIACAHLKSSITYEKKLLKDEAFRKYLCTRSWL